MIGFYVLTKKWSLNQNNMPSIYSIAMLSCGEWDKTLVR